MSFDVEDEDTDSMVDLATDDDRIVVQRAGWFLVSGRVDIWDASGGNLRGCALQHVPVVGSSVTVSAAAPYQLNVTSEVGTSQLFEAAADDYFRLLAFQDSGSTQDVHGVLSVHWMSKP